MDRCIENCFEFLKGEKICTATLSEKRLINKIKKLSEKFPDSFEIVDENQDGSIVVHFPSKLLSIKSPRKSMTEEQKEDFRKRLQG